MTALFLTGQDLTSATLAAAAAAPGGRVELSAEGLNRMVKSRAVIDEAVRNKVPVYGVTTGLGTQITETLSEAQSSEFSLKSLQGRAHAIGDPLPVNIVRAAMIVRANTLLTGAAGASVAVARHLADCINRDLTPIVGDLGSIGSSDLLQSATLGLALTGAGTMRDPSGEEIPSGEAMAAAGLKPLTLGPRDGLALFSNGAMSAAGAALSLTRARIVLNSAQPAAALSFEAFRANLSPIREAVVALRPQPGDIAVAADLARLLAGSTLHRPGAARRLQDPLSLRHVVQVHGAAWQAIDAADEVIRVDLNAGTDSPAVLSETGEVVSTGNYFTPHLTLSLEHVARALAMLANLQVARMAKLLSTRFTGLPMHLAREGSLDNGFAPVLKLAEATLSRIQTDSTPIPFWPSISADGVEDALTHSWETARRLAMCVENCCRLTALELAIATQAVELRGTADSLGPPLKNAVKLVRNHIEPLAEDRPLGAEIAALTDAVSRGKFADHGLPG